MKINERFVQKPTIRRSWTSGHVAKAMLWNGQGHHSLALARSLEVAIHGWYNWFSMNHMNGSSYPWVTALQVPPPPPN
jgi:hypothetical protein